MTTFPFKALVIASNKKLGAIGIHKFHTGAIVDIIDEGSSNYYLDTKVTGHRFINKHMVIKLYETTMQSNSNRHK